MYHQRLLPNLFKSVTLLLVAVATLVGPSLSRVSAAASGSKEGQAEVQAGESANSDAIIAWNKIALRTSVQVAQQNQPQSQMYLAQIQAAVYNAVMAIEGRYQLYESDLELQPGASVDAAVATAAHAMLVHHFPAQQGALDADYTAALAVIPDGDTKTAGK